MSNRNYLRGTARERKVKDEMEAEGWFCVKAGGSKGEVDILCIRPLVGSCSDPWHFEVKAIQVKTEMGRKAYKEIEKAVKMNFGYMNIEYRYYPVRPRSKTGKK